MLTINISGDLWAFLYSGLPDGCVKFGCAVDDLGDDSDRPTINGEAFDLAVLADGGWSKLRGKYISCDAQPEYAGYVMWKGRVDTSEVPGLASHGYHEQNGIYDAMILPVPTCNGQHMFMGGVFMATPRDEIARPEAGAARHTSSTQSQQCPGWFLPFVRQVFGDLAGGDIVRFFEAAASKGKITPSPMFEFGARNTVAGRIVMIGDAAHMASPRTAAGAHTAMLDALSLYEAFESGRGDIDSALVHYNKGGVQRASALFARSRAVSRQFLPRGGLAQVQSPATIVV